MTQSPSSQNYRELMQNALLEIRQLRSQIKVLEAAQVNAPESKSGMENPGVNETGAEAIAIVGMGCRFPGGANNSTQFWQQLAQGLDAITEVPSDRWNVDDYYDSNPATAGKIVTRYGGFVPDLQEFDADFFGIAPREARSLDPQQRLLLEVSWEALEDSGMVPNTLMGQAVGVFVGLCSNDYSQQLLNRPVTDIDAYLATGNSHSTAAGRIAYTLGLTGPCLAIDTACSSSLVAVHLACQSLRQRECTIALAGGVNRIFSPEFSINFSQARMLAPDGRCKTFDQRADGFVRSEGCGVIVLKRLSEAIAANDLVLAVIRGSAVNQDGRSSGLTVPNGPAQQTVIRQALAQANLDPAEVGYIEAHGTGTALGDPIEVGALNAVFGASHSAANPLWISSVKTNIGHLEAAAGIAGLIKVVLAIQHGKIPPHLHLQQPNPHIDWQPAIAIPPDLTEWHSNSTQRIAGISSFGFSGTNAHVIVASPPITPIPTQGALRDRPLHLLTLSAKTPAALEQLTRNYANLLSSHPNLNIADLCFSANTGRSHFGDRLSMLAASSAEALQQLGELDSSLLPSSANPQSGSRGDSNPFPSFNMGEGNIRAEASSAILVSPQPPKLAFLFTGQGSQYGGMAQQLYQTQPTFRQAIARCAELLQPELNIPLLQLLQPGNEQIHQTRYTQPALFAIEYALYQLWRSWGIQPSAVMGHSLGEYVAACIAGVLSLEDALKLVVTRARLMQQLPSNGQMIAVMTSAATAQQLAPDLAIAAINSPTNTVLSGSTIAVERALATFQTENIKATPLTVSHAFHSPLMEPILLAFQTVAERIIYAPPQIPVVSNLTGKMVEVPITAEYWGQHLRQTVQFAQGIETLKQLGCTGFVEIGAKPTLLSLAQDCLGASPDLLWLPSLRPGQADWSVLLTSLKALSDSGYQIDWAGFDRDYPRQRITLPTYPWQRQRYWIERSPQSPVASGERSGHPLLGESMAIARQPQRYFNQTLQAEHPAYLADHRVFGQVILPAAAYLEMALAAAQQVFQTESLQLHHMTMQQPLVLEGDRTVQLIATPESEQQCSWEIVSLSAPETWTTHATGTVNVLRDDLIHPSVSLQQWQHDCQNSVDLTFFYTQFQQYGIDYGESFQVIQQLWQGKNQALAWIELPLDFAHPRDCLQPILLDACFQTIAAILLTHSPTSVYLPFGCDRLCLYRPAPTQCWSAFTMRHQDASVFIADGWILTATGEVIATITGLQLKATSAPSFSQVTPTQPQSDYSWQDWLYQVDWQPLPLQTALDFPTPTAIAQALTAHFDQLLATSELQSYAHQLDNLERQSIAYIVQALHQLGFVWSVDQTLSTAILVNQYRVLPKYQNLSDRLLQILSEVGLLQLISDHERTWKVIQLPNAEQMQIAPISESATIEHPLLDRCASQLANVLRGECDPLQLLFPNGDLSWATQLYQHSRGAATTNDLVQQAIAAICKTLPPGRSLRILELGAGTGGTTAHLLPHLNPHQTTYVFTDLSPLFLSQAKARFQAYEFVDYQILDLERSPLSQNFFPQSFDIVIAANVLHATQDLQQTLTHIHQLLTPGGSLLFVEGTRPARWLDLIFGLTEGWWHFRDRLVRTDYPLISVARWQLLLTTCGFNSSQEIAPSQPRPTALTQQAVILAQASPRTDHWLILGHSSESSDILIEALQNQEQVVTFLSNSSAILEKLKQTQSSPSPITQIIDLRGLELSQIVNDANLDEISQRIVESSLNLIQTLIQLDLAHQPELWVMTQGAISTHLNFDSIPLSGLAQAALIGLVKVATLEHSKLATKHIDLDAEIPFDLQISQLIAELFTKSSDDSIALHQNQRWVSRLQSSDRRDRRLIPHQPYTLTMPKRGTLEDLHWQPVVRRSPTAHEVEIQIQATGLNLIDVLDALNLLPFERDWFGVECAGTIVTVGDAVTQFQVGDAVVALAPGSLSQFVTIDARLVALKPNALSFAAAATIPANFLTAEYALHQVARIQPGDRILIHAAAGGTGMAAVKLAQQVGAEVWATASPHKWGVLRSLGVKHLFNSRTLDFADEILQQIAGVDVVLNSLSGEFIPRSLAALRSGGCFVEIGKRDIWTAAQVQQLRPDVAYATVDLLTVTQKQPDLIQSLLQDLMSRFEGDLQPVPWQSFAATEVILAFRTLQQAKHIGKLVIEHPSPVQIQASATYLITGGLGGLGLAIAQWLVQQGARHLLLLGRSSASPAALETVRSLRARGATVAIVQADVSQQEQVAQALHQIDPNYPLRGIVHSAGVLDDGALSHLTPARMQQVMAPKVAGAWHLHSLTQHLPLDFLVCFSSAASLLGSPGQGNHAAANAFLDAFAHYRHQQGLPALSMNWGVWSEIGSATHVTSQMQQRGVHPISPDQGIAVFATLLSTRSPQVGVIPIDWAKFPSARLQHPFFTAFQHQANRPDPTRDRPGPNVWSQLSQVPGRNRTAQLITYLQTEVGKVLGLSAAQLPRPRDGFFDMGMDSLMMIELRNRLETALGQSIPNTVLFEHPTIADLATYLATTAFGDAAPEIPETIAASPPDPPTPVSDADLDSAIAQELAALENLL
jgi:acyl transferase domain-containing protein/NADPH:quinone reductase-like Zn-dependent oxidoreductase/acyl carrier protein